MKGKILSGLSLIVWLGNSMATESRAPTVAFEDANKGLNVSLFSAVRGQLLEQGEPLEGIKVERSYHFTWAGKDYKEVTYTDKQGKFYFDEAVKFMLFGRVLPHEPVIPQKISIYHRDASKAIDIWQHSKRNYNTMGEMNGLDKYISRASEEQMTDVMWSYTQGEIALKCDLNNIRDDNNDHAELQYASNYTAVFSLCELQLPYQVAVDHAKQLIEQKKPKILQALALYLVNGTAVFNVLREERFRGFQDLGFVSIESIRLYDRLELQNHLEDYASNSLSISLSGEVILQMKNSQQQPVRVRLWLNHGVFRIDPQGVRFTSDYHSLVFNEFNIDAETPP